MQTKNVFGVVMAFAVSFALLSGSGVGSAVFGENPDTQTLEEFETVAEENKEPNFNVLSSLANVPFLGIILQFGDIATTFVGTVAGLPFVLMRLGFPRYFALPVGTIAQIIAIIGMFQLVTGREFL